MAKPYTMKDLGYKRTPAPEGAVLVVTFSNGERWSVPMQVIADSVDANYANVERDTIGLILRNFLGKYDLKNWATNDMNWSELEPYATRLRSPLTFDYDADWPNATKDIRI